MSNQAYLTASDVQRIYPGFENPDFDPEVSWVLSSGGCLPLLWLPLFAESDLASATFLLEGQESKATAPLVLREVAVGRLRSRSGFLNTLFRANGGLQPHIDLLASYLEGCTGSYLTMEVEEIAMLHEEGHVDALLRHALAGLDAADTGVKEALVELSTVMPERPFITLADAAGGDCEEEDMWNFFRILGEAYLREDVPWM